MTNPNSSSLLQRIPKDSEYLQDPRSVSMVGAKLLVPLGTISYWLNDYTIVDDNPEQWFIVKEEVRDACIQMFLRSVAAIGDQVVSQIGFVWDDEGREQPRWDSVEIALSALVEAASSAAKGWAPVDAALLSLSFAASQKIDLISEMEKILSRNEDLWGYAL